MSGVNTTQPHGEPSDKVIEDGDFVTMDFGAVVDGYCGDVTRTIGIGHLSEEQIKVYDIVLHSQMAGLAACKAGVRCSDVDAAAETSSRKLDTAITISTAQDTVSGQRCMKRLP